MVRLFCFSTLYQREECEKQFSRYQCYRNGASRIQKVNFVSFKQYRSIRLIVSSSKGKLT